MIATVLEIVKVAAEAVVIMLIVSDGLFFSVFQLLAYSLEV